MARSPPCRDRVEIACALVEIRGRRPRRQRQQQQRRLRQRQQQPWRRDDAELSPDTCGDWSWWRWWLFRRARASRLRATTPSGLLRRPSCSRLRRSRRAAPSPPRHTAQSPPHYRAETTWARGRDHQASTVLVRTQCRDRTEITRRDHTLRSRHKLTGRGPNDPQDTELAKTLAAELEWVRSNPKARQTKSKARLARYEEMLNTPTREALAHSATIYVPPGPRLGSQVRASLLRRRVSSARVVRACRRRGRAPSCQPAGRGLLPRLPPPSSSAVACVLTAWRHSRTPPSSARHVIR